MKYTKIKIQGTIRVVTGLHIGGDTSFSAIGAIDMPVVRDPLTREPIIPGSTLKGKMRTLLARSIGTTPVEGPKGFEGDDPEVKRLFGSAAEKSDAKKKGVQMSRLQFADCFLTNGDRLEQVFENKYENTIDRLTSIANPRQIERVVRGAEFGLDIIYNVENEEEVTKDFENIRLGLTLIENDYLGGGGTRGNGRVKFEGLTATVVTGDKDFDLAGKIVTGGEDLVPIRVTGDKGSAVPSVG